MGLGCSRIKKSDVGDLIYTPNPLLDVDLSQEQFNSLDTSEQDEVRYYGFYDELSSRWHVAFEVIRFLNHGSKESANVTQDENMVMTAKKKISFGEELLQDYS